MTYIISVWNSVKKLQVFMPWIWNHKHKIEEKSTKSSWASSKVVGLRPADLWKFATLYITWWYPLRRVNSLSLSDTYDSINWAIISSDINLLVPGRYGSNFQSIIFKVIVQNRSLCFHCQIALRWMPMNFTNKRSSLVQVMAWCRQATSHYVNQYWPRSPTPFGISWPQWVNLSTSQ